MHTLMPVIGNFKKCIFADKIRSLLAIQTVALYTMHEDGIFQYF